MRTRTRLAVTVLAGLIMTLIDWFIPQDGTAGLAVDLWLFVGIPLSMGLCCIPLRSYRTVAYVVPLGCLCAKSSDILFRYPATRLSVLFFHHVVELAFMCVSSWLLLTAATFLHRRYRPVYLLGHCQECGYNLTGNVSGVCPECGKGIAIR